MVLLLRISSTVQNKNLPGRKVVYVIVHGVFGEGVGHKKVYSLLTAEGHMVYRPSLTG